MKKITAGLAAVLMALEWTRLTAGAQAGSAPAAMIIAALAALLAAAPEPRS